MITETDIQIRFADVDILGHVNNVNLQHYFDLGKSDFFRRAVGLETYWKEEGIITASTSNSYVSQTRMEDRVYVETRIEKIGNKSFTVAQRLISRDTAEVRAESVSVMVAFDFTRQESIVIPSNWRNLMESSIGNK